MKILTGIIAVCLVSTLSFNCLASSKNYDGNQCYWMENVSGRYEWVATDVVGFGSFSKEDCFAMDSCDGGLGQSGGGCYKWAKSPQGEREPWDGVTASAK